MPWNPKESQHSRKYKRRRDIRPNTGMKIYLWRFTQRCTLCGAMIEHFGDASTVYRTPLVLGGKDQADNMDLAHTACADERQQRLSGHRDDHPHLGTKKDGNNAAE